MAVELTPRMQVHQWTLGTDPYNRAQRNLNNKNIEDRAAGFLKGTAAARPAASALMDRFFYWAHDTDTMSVCTDAVGDGTGYAWRPVGEQFKLATTANATYYVDETTGSDADDGLTAATAKASWAGVMALIPQVVDHAIVIEVVGNLTVRPEVAGRIGGGSITVYGNSRVAANHSAPGMFIEDCALPVSFHFMKFTSTAHIHGSTYGSIRDCQPQAVGDVGVVVIRSFGYVRDCNFGAGIVTDCIQADLAQVTSWTNSGSGTRYGLYANNTGYIGKTGGQPTGAVLNEADINGSTITAGGPLVEDVRVFSTIRPASGDASVGFGGLAGLKRVRFEFYLQSTAGTGTRYLFARPNNDATAGAYEQVLQKTTASAVSVVGAFTGTLFGLTDAAASGVRWHGFLEIGLCDEGAGVMKPVKWQILRNGVDMFVGSGRWNGPALGSFYFDLDAYTFGTDAPNMVVTMEGWK